MTSDVRDILLKIQSEANLLRTFTDDDLDRIAPYFEVFQFPAGTIVSKPGEALDMMGIMVSGEVLIEEETELKGNWIVLYRMVRGAILAHPSLFGTAPPPVRVLVKDDTTFLGTTGAGFEDLLQKHPDTGIKFLKELVRVLFARTRGLAKRFGSAF